MAGRVEPPQVRKSPRVLLLRPEGDHLEEPAGKVVQVLRVRQPRLERQLGAVRAGRFRPHVRVRQQRRLDIGADLPERDEHVGREEDTKLARHRMQCGQLVSGDHARAGFLQLAAAAARETPRVRRMRQFGQDLEGRRR